MFLSTSVGLELGWQKGEREVNEALAKGEYEEFDIVYDLIANLHRHSHYHS